MGSHYTKHIPNRPETTQQLRSSSRRAKASIAFENPGRFPYRPARSRPVHQSLRGSHRPPQVFSDGAHRVTPYRRLRDPQAELQQLAVDPRRTPERIRAAHLPYQIPQVPPNCGPTPSPSTLPRPVASKSLAVPQLPSPVAPPAANAASSSTASKGKPRTSGPCPSAAAAAGAPSTRRVAAEARGSLVPTPDACAPRTAVSQGRSKAI